MGSVRCGRSPKEGGLSGPPADWGGPHSGASLPSPCCQPAQPCSASRPWQAPWRGCFGGSPGPRRAPLHRRDRGRGDTLPGELPVRHQPLPWRGTGVSRGESPGPARGVALPQTSGAPRSKTRGQCRDGTEPGEQSQGPGPVRLRQRGIGQRQLAGSSPEMFRSRGR